MENEEKNQNNNKKPERSSIRTYASDIAELVKKGISLSDVAISEQQRKFSKGVEQKIADEEIKRKKRSQLMLFAGIVIFALGIIVIASIFLLKRENGDENVIEIPSLIYSNSTSEIALEEIERTDTLKTIGQTRSEVSGTLGSITNTYLTLPGQPASKFVKTSEFLEGIEVGAPSSFTRALGNTFMLGVHVFDNNQAFLIFEVNSFENALSGILNWEERMLDDLWPMFHDAKPVVVEKEETQILQRNFEDIVVKNRDARVLRDQSGDIALIYSFPDRRHLIITTDDRTLVEIYDRLTTGRFRN